MQAIFAAQTTKYCEEKIIGEDMSFSQFISPDIMNKKQEFKINSLLSQTYSWNKCGLRYSALENTDIMSLQYIKNILFWLCAIGLSFSLEEGSQIYNFLERKIKGWDKKIDDQNVRTHKITTHGVYFVRKD